ncbi:unnamed protein product [Linum tenue]|uniref:Uncharacterized protein n=1 Tax=Linum tenue TaxID=586396 RepID=A0AAV0N0I2_9ROSI|nr:unnamed protein product [Linum tenue]
MRPGRRRRRRRREVVEVGGIRE